MTVFVVYGLYIVVRKKELFVRIGFLEWLQ